MGLTFCPFAVSLMLLCPRSCFARSYGGYEARVANIEHAIIEYVRYDTLMERATKTLRHKEDGK